MSGQTTYVTNPLTGTTIPLSDLTIPNPGTNENAATENHPSFTPRFFSPAEILAIGPDNESSSSSSPTETYDYYQCLERQSTPLTHEELEKRALKLPPSFHKLGPYTVWGPVPVPEPAPALVEDGESEEKPIVVKDERPWGMSILEWKKLQEESSPVEQSTPIFGLLYSVFLPRTTVVSEYIPDTMLLLPSPCSTPIREQIELLVPLRKTQPQPVIFP
ncbi:uncharacterized protein STEHIDRAFT_159702 [Stereum hirsutum FP-91666 SS1]|uniref:uncharacterized protein n=1 Tax=Stereum hirsutum (strain FP-91666) TaxID=721885 RepID=UPI000444A1F7|nr:uncharacterized protein STEHIDRAFT_159702 [Stereum hirsutum FP-91666 SS1]EIM84106.1 hypothetical protein STEHIDRAFT_159702 [Stereum hirsutum FP-91666 SS1]